MKRTFSLILALIFVLALSPAVRADVIVSPVEILLGSIDIRTVLIATALVAAGSGLFLWITRKKK